MTSQRNDRPLTCVIADAGQTRYDAPAFSVILPGVAGVAEVLAGHAEAFIALGTGDVVLWATEDADEQRFPVDGGVAHVRNDKVVVLG